MSFSKKKKQAAGSRQRSANITTWQWDHIHLIIYLLAVAAFLTVGVALLLYWFTSLHIPDLSSVERYQPPATTVILDDKGRVVDRLFRENRFVIPLGRMPDYLVDAFVAAEDARFYQHGGIDVWSTLRALINNFREGAKSQGGSTITQQVTRALLLSPEKTYIRKFKEAVLAYRIDRLLSKNDILYIYLNQIYLGEGAYGVEAAAQVYFGKHAAQLNLAEASLLAGLPQAPSRYSPFKNYRLAKHRQAYVLNQMAADGYITATMARRAYAKPLRWAPPQREEKGNEYFLQQVKNYVADKYGQQALLSGGLVIYTTLDQQMQKAADKAVRYGVDAWQKRHKGKAPPQAALLAISVADGAIRAMVGGTDFASSQFNRATQALRQPGSAFKPFVYAVALAKGMTPATMVDDHPLALPGSEQGSIWRPRNFDNEYLGPVTLRDALVHSLNSASIQVLQQVGVDDVILQARRFGIRSPLQHDLSLALGASEVNLEELTGAYAALANKGRFIEPYQVTRIRDRTGRILEARKIHPVEAYDARHAYQLTSLLQDVIREGTGRRAKGLAVAEAGKTGTTDQNRDAWFIGYTPDLAAGVWLGFDQKKTLGRGETGGRAAAPVWARFMAGVAGELHKKRFDLPPDMSIIPVDLATGELMPNGLSIPGRKIRREIFLSNDIPEKVQWLGNEAKVEK